MSMFSPRARATFWSLLQTALMMAAALLAVHLWQTRDVPRATPAPFVQATVVQLQTGAGLGAAALTNLDAFRAAHPGRAVALHFWADWCPICKMEEGQVSRVAADWPVLTVATRSGNAANVQRHLAQRGLNWHTVLDANGAIAKAHGLQGVPALVVFKPNGEVSAVTVGYTTELGLRARLWWAQGLK